MGEPPSPPKTDKGWDSDDAFQTDFTEAKNAEKSGDPAKMTVLTGRMDALEAAGKEFYPGSPKAITLG